MDQKEQHIVLRQFNRFMIEEKISKEQRMLLAVSGGVDSVVLCELCHQAGFSFDLAHCNFNLRGEESERDEAFVRSLGLRYGATVHVKKFETSLFADEQKLSIQEAARELRYAWFRELRKSGEYSFIVLAHHADDNLETLLMNFFRGSGLQGLTGIPSKTDELLRPLINTRKKDILDFAKQQQLSWVEDISNKSVKYTRNYFRNELIPSIKKVFPQAEENLLDTISRMKKINGFYQQSVSKALDAICEKKGNEIRIPVRKLKKLDYPVLIYELIRPFGFGEKQVEEVIRLMDSESGRYIENSRYQIIRHGLWLIIAPVTEIADLIVIDEGKDQVNFPGGSLEIKKPVDHSLSIQTSEWIAQLDARDIEFPLVLRRWKAGDYFYPLGMRKKKKLSRFFIDQKLPKNQKENTWVLESNKRIIWVVGMRIDDRFKITGSTSKVLLLTYQNKVL